MDVTTAFIANKREIRSQGSLSHFPRKTAVSKKYGGGERKE